jgi:hypothetical protein
MSADELLHRGREIGRRAADRVRVATIAPRWRRRQLAGILAPGSSSLAAARELITRGDWTRAHASLSLHFMDRAPRFVIHPSARPNLIAAVHHSFPEAAAGAAERARQFADGEYDLLGYRSLRFAGAGGAIDWHFDPVSGRRAPTGCWTAARYLDPRWGDHKVVWELNRHQHWIALGRAEWLTGDGSARASFIRQLQQWLQTNPPLVGMNWASALELGLRALSWTWALELFVATPPAGEPPWTLDLLLGLDRQLAHVERHLSRYFSPNTHLLGEALALYVCGRALPELRASARRAALGREVLLQERVRQVLPDGGHVERSPHYHRYALEFFLLALSVARVTGDREMADALAPVAQRMAAFLRHFCDAAGRYPNIGDDDGGELCPIAGHNHGHARQTLGWAAAVLGRPGLAIGPPLESVLWLTAHETLEAPPVNGGTRGHTSDAATLQRSVVFADTGYLAARHGGSLATMDVGAHGFLNGGHAHADSLALTIVAKGAPLLIDPGTATYTMDPVLRNRLRSSQWHNTLSLDGRSQAEPAGPFGWATTASARLRHAALNPRFDYVDADTNAWSPLAHRRIFLMADDDYWVVADGVLGTGHHRADLYWHIDPLWEVQSAEPSVVRLSHCFGGAVTLSVSNARLDVFHADAASGLGWTAPVYGRVVPAATIRAHADHAAPFWIVTTIDATGSHDEGAAARLDVLAAGDGGDPIAVRTTRGNVSEVTLCRAEALHETITTGLDPRHERAITTDARLVHARVREPGRIERLYLVDATVFRFDGVEPLTLTAASRIPDLAVTIPANGEPVLESSVAGVEVSMSIGRDREEPGRLHFRTPAERTNPPCAV